MLVPALQSFLRDWDALEGYAPETANDRLRNTCDITSHIIYIVEMRGIDRGSIRVRDNFSGGKPHNFPDKLWFILHVNISYVNIFI